MGATAGQQTSAEGRKGRKTGKRTRRNTKHDLIMTAMRLFAQKGFSDVSLRMVSSEAGSKNTAAVHYYFGNKRGLIDAVLEQIEQDLFVSAASDLDEAATQGASLEEVLKIGLAAVKALGPDPEPTWRNDARLVLYQATHAGDPETRTAYYRTTRTWRQAFQSALKAHLGDLPDDVFRMRYRFFMTEVINGQMLRYQISRKDQKPSESEIQTTDVDDKIYLSYLMDYAVGGLTAPHTRLAN